MKSEQILVQWGLVSENGRGPYLAGREDFGQTRTSTPLLELDLEAGTALTASDRRYRLQGKPDPDYALLVARSVWGDYFDLTGSVIRSLSPAEATTMIRWNGNRLYDDTPEERAAYARQHGIPWDPETEEIVPWASGRVWKDLAIPDPEDDEEDDMPGYTVGVVPEVKASLIISIKDSMWRKQLSLTEAAWIAGITPDRLRGIVERRQVHAVSADDLDRVLQAIDDWEPEPPMKNDF